MKSNKNKTVLIFSILIICLFSCRTFDKKNPYPNMETLSYPNSQAYVFPTDKSDKLIIVIEGNGWNSALGRKENNIWTSVYSGAQFLQELNEYYNFLIPEKLSRQPGENYFEDMEDRANYTAENLIACYTESINSFLAEENFSSIVLVGASEGAILLPIIYENMDDKDKVVAMVSISFGGLSLYESYKILSRYQNLPSDWIAMYSDIVDKFKPSNSQMYNSFEEDYYETTFRWLNSFLHIKPYDYYKDINIPILFIHGMKDINIPFESTYFIQKNLTDKLFEYRYYQKWDHQPRNYRDWMEFRKDTANWIMNKTF